MKASKITLSCLAAALFFSGSALMAKPHRRCAPRRPVCRHRVVHRINPVQAAILKQQKIERELAALRMREAQLLAQRQRTATVVVGQNAYYGSTYNNGYGYNQGVGYGTSYYDARTAGTVYYPTTVRYSDTATQNARVGNLR